MELVLRIKRYTPEATALLRRIDVAKSRIEASQLLPAQEMEMRKISQAESVHYSNQLEGNLLSLAEAQRAVAGELEVDDRAKLELVNYVRALRLIDDLYGEGRLTYDPATLLSIHGALTRGLGGTKKGFDKRHEGAWRDGEVRIEDPISGEVFHEGEPAETVPGFMQWLCDYLERNSRRPIEYPAPVLAGVAHWAMTWVHPFADGNGRMARLLTSIILLKEGYQTRRIFSFERHYAADKQAYFAALRTVRRHDKDLTPWLAYFLDGLCHEYEQVATRIAILSQVSGYVKERTELSVREERALSDLVAQRRSTFTRVEYQDMSKTSRQQARDDLEDLIEAGVLYLVRRGSASTYHFARGALEVVKASKWTPERIEAELRSFLEGYERWPSHAEWQASGQLGFYQVLSNHGGVKRWRRKMGY